jgi:hypothetical protein
MPQMISRVQSIASQNPVGDSSVSLNPGTSKFIPKNPVMTVSGIAITVIMVSVFITSLRRLLRLDR